MMNLVNVADLFINDRERRLPELDLLADLLGKSWTIALSQGFPSTRDPQSRAGQEPSR
ncbi:hypothetical protein MXD58_021140 [Frankia sp. AgKG'84/4]|nr:hypothetical protein [Frankia sp. AgKG'84/4]